MTRSEPEPVQGVGGWSVWREDDHGRRVEVRRALSRDAAAALASRLEAGGHKQTYWIAPTRRGPW